MFERLLLALDVAAGKVNVLGQSSGWAEMVPTYISFGDPATTLGLTAPNTPKLFLPLVRR